MIVHSLMIKNNKAIFTFTMDDNSQDTFVSDYTGMIALVINGRGEGTIKIS